MNRNGPTGPTGLTGAAAETVLDDVQVQLQGSSGGTVVNNVNVLFDTMINSPSANITYNAGTETFFMQQPGNYLISRWVNTDGAGAETIISFGVRVLGGSVSPSVFASSPSPVTTLQLNGSVLLTITGTPTTFSLFNNSGATVSYGTSDVQTNLIIIDLT